MLRKDQLLQASSVSLSVDDRKDYRLVRYRCSFIPKQESSDQANPRDQAPGHEGPGHNVQGDLSLKHWCDQKICVHEGLLGVYKIGGNVAENTLESHDADKSMSMAESIHTVMERTCQDPDGHVDADCLQEIGKKVRHFASDQGPSVAKCAKVLAVSPKLPNLVWVSFDAAHQVRLAFKDPLNAVPEFSEQWEHLFGTGKGIIPQIQHSEVWKSRLTAAQRLVLEQHGGQGGVEKVLQSLSFAGHRFETGASPMFKYCCAIRSIATVCAMQAADAP